MIKMEQKEKFYNDFNKNKDNKIKPENRYCSFCASRNQVTRHHPDYSKKNDFILLCKSCHMKLHKTKPRLTTPFKEYKHHLTCSKETKDMILNDCVKEFLGHHPEFEQMNITSGFILRRLAEFYIKD